MSSRAMMQALAVKLLTTGSGRYPLTAQARQWICLTEDGQLYLSTAHESQDAVLLLIEQLRRDNFSFTIQLVSVEFIADLYSCWSPHNHSELISYCQNQGVEIIQQAVATQASDVHFVVRKRVTLIKFRIHGELLLVAEYSREEGQTFCATNPL